jgi:hypothetical protein
MGFRQGYASKLGGLNFRGYWNAATNTPTLSNSSANRGDYYIVSVAGTTNLSGTTDWQPGDWLLFSGTGWQKIDTTDEVKLDSPAFTGAPTAPTPDANDNSDKIATTAFVQQVAATSGFIDGGTPSSDFDSLVVINGGTV